MVRLWLSSVIFFIIAGCGQVEKYSPEQQVLIEELKTYILAHQQTPENYILSKFKDYDVIILGEQHRIKHDVELIQRLIPLLYENGIYTLATEFGRREDQPLIDSLLEGKEYDEQLVHLIGFKQFIHWGYREYVDIYKAAWELNHSLKEGQRLFRILGMNDSPDWSIMKKPEDREIDSLKRLVWKGSGEKYWAEVVLNEVEKGEKVLVYSGIHHAFSEYLQPIIRPDGEFIRFEDNRMGRHIYNAIGRKVITIFLHAMWNGPKGYNDKWVRPADGLIDEVMEQLGEKFQPVGFDIAGSPFAKIIPQNAVYRTGYNPFTLDRFCNGWIFQKPFKEFQTVTYIDGFINENNLEYAQQQSPNPRYRNASVEKFVSTEKDLLNKMEKLLQKL